MARPRSIPDADILGAVRDLMIGGGAKAVSFSSVSQATGLAGSSLVQRFGNRERMLRAALNDGWEVLMRRTEAAAAEAPRNAKGVSVFLKALARGDGGLVALLASRQRDPALRDAAEAWRTRMEAELALRMGAEDATPREAAAMAFAAWIGRMVWDGAGPGDARGFKLKSLTRYLG